MHWLKQCVYQADTSNKNSLSAQKRKKPTTLVTLVPGP